MGLLALALDQRCQGREGIGVIMERAIVAKSRKAIKQAKRVKRLTAGHLLHFPVLRGLTVPEEAGCLCRSAYPSSCGLWQ